MAIIRSITKGASSVKRHPTSTDATYQVVADAEGTLLHLSTYGSDQRKSGAKVSQTFQLDRDAARTLVDAIHEAFPGI